MSKERDKGTAWETAVVKYARANGFGAAQRQPLSGAIDRGDLSLCAGVIAQCKAWAKFTDANVREWQEQTWRQMNAANAAVGLLIVKRQGVTGQPANAHTWHRGEWGLWYMLPLSDALERLRLCGYGDLV